MTRMTRMTRIKPAKESAKIRRIRVIRVSIWLAFLCLSNYAQSSTNRLAANRMIQGKR